MKWIRVKDKLPGHETPVLVVHNGLVRIAEIRTEYPSYEENFHAYDYWDDPVNDGQDIEWSDVTSWMPIPEIP